MSAEDDEPPSEPEELPSEPDEPPSEPAGWAPKNPSLPESDESAGPAKNLAELAERAPWVSAADEEPPPEPAGWAPNHPLLFPSPLTLSSVLVFSSFFLEN